jgi:hypothetical protein
MREAEGLGPEAGRPGTPRWRSRGWLGAPFRWHARCVTSSRGSVERPARDDSYESLFHEAGVPGLLLGLRPPLAHELRHALSEARLERAIGVIYRPETELASHYFRAVPPRQFDEFVWLDRTRAVEALDVRTLSGVPDTYPFGL